MWPVDQVHLTCKCGGSLHTLAYSLEAKRAIIDQFHEAHAVCREPQPSSPQDSGETG